MRLGTIKGFKPGTGGIATDGPILLYVQSFKDSPATGAKTVGGISRQVTFTAGRADSDESPEIPENFTYKDFFYLEGSNWKDSTIKWAQFHWFELLAAASLVPESTDDLDEETEFDVENGMDFLYDESGDPLPIAAYWFAGDETHWGKAVFLTPSNYEAACQGQYVPAKPDLNVKKPRKGKSDEDNVDAEGGGDETTQVAATPARAAAPAPRPATPAARPAAPAAAQATPAARPVAPVQRPSPPAQPAAQASAQAAPPARPPGFAKRGVK